MYAVPTPLVEGTQCIVLNEKENTLYVATVNSMFDDDKRKQYSFEIIPKDKVVRSTPISRAKYLKDYLARREAENDRIEYLLSLLDKSKFRVFNRLKLISPLGEAVYFENVVVSNSALFNILPSHQIGNLYVSDDGYLTIDRDGNKEGILIPNQVHMGERRKLLQEFGAPVIDVIVLTNEKATISNEGKFHMKVVKFDHFNSFLESYNSKSNIDINQIEDSIHKLKKIH